MNGNSVGAAAGVPGVGVNHEFVRLLKAVLGDAEQGRILGGAVIVAPSRGSFLCFGADGGCKSEMIAGAEVLKTDIIRQMQTPQQSKILPVRSLG